ncbi:hypothetical protein AAG906_013018 [Vitis piasezkii]
MNDQRLHPERVGKCWPLHCVFLLTSLLLFPFLCWGLVLQAFAMEVAGDSKASSSWKMAKNVRKLLEKTPKDEAVSARDKILGSRFPSSVSAQDLRLLDMKKGKDEHTPKGILEFCAESFVPEMQTSCLGSSESKRSRARSHWRSFLSRFTKNSIKRKSQSARENVLAVNTFNSSWKNFSLVELQNATKNFHHENLIGKGGYAEVFKGRLKDGQFIAIKRLTQGTPEERVMSFLHELGIIAHVNHPNTAKLIGYGVQGGLHLVLQLSPLGSLGSLLHVTKSKLEWSSRYKIALGTADGLRYLHEHCQRRIIHRDIKADNILLTEDFEPQICDFGLAKWLPKQWTHFNVTKFEGTFGYIFFWVLLLELITGRRAVDHMKQSLVVWAKPLLYKNSVAELVDPALDEYDEEEMDRMLLTASLCIEQSPVLRPRMNQASTNFRKVHDTPSIWFVQSHPDLTTVSTHSWVMSIIMPLIKGEHSSNMTCFSFLVNDSDHTDLAKSAHAVVVLLRGDEYNPDGAQESQNHMPKRTYSNEILDAAEYNSTKCLDERLGEDQ